MKLEEEDFNIKVKERPFAEGSRDYSCARAFYFESIEILKV